MRTAAIAADGDVLHATLTRAEKRGLRCSTKLAFGTEQWSVVGLRSKLRRRQVARRTAYVAMAGLIVVAVVALMPMVLS